MKQWLEVSRLALGVINAGSEDCGGLDIAMGTRGCLQHLMSSFGREAGAPLKTLKVGRRAERLAGNSEARVSRLLGWWCFSSP